MPPLQDIYVAYGLFSLSVSLIVAAVNTLGHFRPVGWLLLGLGLVPMGSLYWFSLTYGFQLWVPLTATGFLVWGLVCAPLLSLTPVVYVTSFLVPRVWVGRVRYIGSTTSVLVGAMNMNWLSGLIAAAN